MKDFFRQIYSSHCTVKLFTQIDLTGFYYKESMYLLVTKISHNKCIFCIKDVSSSEYERITSNSGNQDIRVSKLHLLDSDAVERKGSKSVK
jgi:hypothetical protein